MREHVKRLFSFSATAFLLYTSDVYAQSQDQLVKSIMKLREDVETLYSKIDDNKESYKAQMKSFTMQKADMEAQINRKETQLKLLRSDLQKIRAKEASLQKTTEDLTPLILKVIDRLEDKISKGIPFKTAIRLEELKKIKKHLLDKTLSPEKGLSMVWASYDDLIRLTKEIGLFKQQIKVDGKEKLAQIAKLGTIALYFSTPDDKVGYVIKKDGGYSYKSVNDKKEKAQIVALFDALKKQIRTGYFELPNALITEDK